MALTALQRAICRLIADNRKYEGEAYVAGGVALNALLGGSRLSRDIDLFHDTQEALQATWDADRHLLTEAGFGLKVVRERQAFVECVVRQGEDSVVMQWVQDSAFRFFPLVEHPDFGLVLHPFDLATNKVLALVGRLEVRDWLDVISCHERLQPLGYLAWAACGKDPGLNPRLILREASRSGRYSEAELDSLAFAGTPPTLPDAQRRWRAMLTEAEGTLDILPPAEIGRCVLGADLNLFRGDAAALAHALCVGGVRFHGGSIRGVLPQFRI
ncbi:MAG: nucleotidyl transferase AbiEii/AbiGii toxin family protein [Opitutaceae bacterium]